MRNVRAKISSLLPPKNAIGFEYAENHSDIGLKCDECLPDCHHVVSFIQFGMLASVKITFLNYIFAEIQLSNNFVRS